MSIYCDHPAPGTGSIFFPTTGTHLVYQCDSLGHRIVVTDGTGRVVRAFGGHGRKSGCLDTPLDLVFVQPQFAGERLPADTADAVWLAVADYGNRRVQVFELDGAPVGELRVDGPDGCGVPPTGLTWRGPVLEVCGIEGARTAVHLSAALLSNEARYLGRNRAVAAIATGARH